MPTLGRILREPLLHFLLIGTLIFVTYKLLNPVEPQEADGQEISISLEQIDQFKARFEETWRRSPNVDELNGLIENHLREEILVRQAIALSLDKGDIVIRRRLAQKMDFLLESAASSREPSEMEIEAFYEANADEYLTKPTYSFEQVFLGQSPSEEEVESTVAALNSGGDPSDFGSRNMLPSILVNQVAVSVDGIFGPGFSTSLNELEPGIWSGPVQSAFGLHAVRLTDRTAAIAQPLASIRDRVRSDWKGANVSEMMQAMYRELRENYTIVLPTEVELRNSLQ